MTALQAPPAMTYLRTIRHLRWTQLMGQVRARIRPVKAVAPAGAAVRLNQTAGRAGPARFARPSAPLHTEEELRAGRFTFLNRTQELGWPPRWEARLPSHLWAYQLHGFDWLWDLGYEAASGAFRDWMRRYPARPGQTGWEPYPTSVRLTNALMFFLIANGEATQRDVEFAKELGSSLHHHGRWIGANLEYRLLGNHLLENAVALALCGALLEAPGSEEMRCDGLRLLRDELNEQLLPDGLHFERSPMYHGRVVALLLLLGASGDEALTELSRRHLPLAMEALRRMAHPDGRIALFNDAVFGIVADPECQQAVASELGFAGDLPSSPTGAWALPDAGYYGFRDQNGCCLIVDAGPIGPDYLPGHGHGDMFSFELSLYGRRVVVDAGVEEYAPGPRRDYARSTRAHNTVEIGGADQCEFWQAFRVARRGRPRDVDFEGSRNSLRVSAWHDGYKRLPGQPRHRRTFEWNAPGRLRVNDEVRAGAPVTAVSRLHLHPDCVVERVTSKSASVRFETGRCVVRFSGEGRLEVENSTYSPEFGRADPNRALAFHAEGERIDIEFHLEAEGL